MSPQERFHMVLTTCQTTLREGLQAEMGGDHYLARTALLGVSLDLYLNPDLMSGPPVWVWRSQDRFISSSC